MQEKKEKPNYYAIVPATIRYDTDITPNAKLLYAEITALCNEKGYCWSNNDYFANLYKVTKTSISKWISQLELKGYITTELIYKNGTKQVLNRYIRIVKDPIEEKLNTYITKVKYPIEEKLNTPIEEKLKDNNTSTNNTFNNKEKIYKKETTTKKFKKPTLEELQNYCKEKDYKIDCEYFIDYYESKGWVVGKSPMKDWKASVRTWVRNNQKFNKSKKDIALPEWFGKEIKKEEVETDEEYERKKAEFLAKVRKS